MTDWIQTQLQTGKFSAFAARLLSRNGKQQQEGPDMVDLEQEDNLFARHSTVLISDDSLIGRQRYVDGNCRIEFALQETGS